MSSNGAGRQLTIVVACAAALALGVWVLMSPPSQPPPIAEPEEPGESVQPAGSRTESPPVVTPSDRGAGRAEIDERTVSGRVPPPKDSGPPTLDDLIRLLNEPVPDDVVAQILGMVRELDPDGSASDREVLSRFSPHLTMFAKRNPGVLPEFRAAFVGAESTAEQIVAMSPIRNAGVRGELAGVLDDFLRVYSETESSYLQQLLIQNCGSLHESDGAIDLIGFELDKPGADSIRGVALALAGYETLLRSEARIAANRAKLPDGLDHELVRRYPSTLDLPNSLPVISSRLIGRASAGDLGESELVQIALWLKARDPDSVETLVVALAPLGVEAVEALKRAGININK